MDKRQQCRTAESGQSERWRTVEPYYLVLRWPGWYLWGWCLKRKDFRPFKLNIWIIVIAVIKAINLISGYVMRKEMAALHTAMNKVTGILLFMLPLTITFVDLKYSGAFVSAVATFAAIQEGHYIRTGRCEIEKF